MESHLLQMRGLKPGCLRHAVYHEVASFTDAWIETGAAGEYTGLRVSRIFYRCVD